MVRVRGKVGRGAFRHDFGPEQMFSFAAAVFWCRLIEKKRWFDECRRR